MCREALESDGFSGAIRSLGSAIMQGKHEQQFEVIQA